MQQHTRCQIVLFNCIIALCFSAGCSEEPSNNGQPTPSDAETSRVVDAQGAQLTTDDAVIAVPAGALDADVEITVSTVSSPPPLPAGKASASNAVAFEPHGQTFLNPVEIKLDVTSGTPTEILVLEDDQDTTWGAIRTGRRHHVGGWRSHVRDRQL